jgi:prepilin-type N-terminal cleavage/methylation domain-containing protein
MTREFFKNRGMTVVETIVAIGIFAILSTVAYEIYIGVDNLVKRADQKSTALWLAEEGIEAARSIRDEAFINLTDGTHGLSDSGNKWVLSGSSDVNGDYTRSLEISTISSNEKDVLATISWTYKGLTNTLSLNSRLTNWHKLDYNAGLTVEKVVINHGGNATSSRFAPYTVSITIGTTTTDTVVEAGVANQFAPGTYTVTETPDADYTATFSEDCNSSGEVTVVASSTVVCRITNEEKPSKLRVNKTVINHGSSKVVSDFSLLVDANPVTSGVLNTFDSGLHTVSETPDAQYDTTIGGDCSAGGLVTLVPNTTKTCSVTNEEKLAYVAIYKNIINHGGTAVEADFAPYKVGATTVTLGATTTKDSGTYTVSETVSPAYDQTFSGDCNGVGSITLVGGTTKTCTITNEEKLVAPTVTSPTATSISTSSAILGANVTSTGVPYTLTARGICYSTSPGPTLTNGATCVPDSATTTGIFTQAFTGLSPSTTYYYVGYATNSTGTGYSVDGTFTTLSNNIVPTVTTPTVTSITSITATLGATVTSLGLPATLTARGICYNTSGTPSLTNGATCVTATLSQTLTAYTVGVTGLIPGTIYYFAGYATNSTGTGYSADGTFTTLGNPGGACTVTGITPTVGDSSGATSLTIAKPTGVVQNDLLFAYIGHLNATDRLNAPAGWTQIGRNKNGSVNQALFYKVAGASEPANYTFTLTASSRFGVSINAFRGCFDIANPVATFSNTQYVVNNNIYRAASINLTSPYSTVIVFPSVIVTGAKSFTAPATQGGGWATDYNQGNASSQFSRSAFSKTITSAGATLDIDSVGTFTGTTQKHSFGVGLKPL